MKRVLRTSISLLLLAALLLPMVLHGSITAKAETQPENGAFAGWSATLTDDIAVNFYFRIAEADVATTALNVTVARDAYSIPAANAVVKNGYYVFPVNIAAAQMTETIHLELVNGANTVHSGDYTFRGYAESVLKGNYSDGDKEMVKKTLNFGAAAQTYFNYKKDDLANTNYPIDNNSLPAPTNVKKAVVSGQVPGVTLYGITLMFQSKTAVRFYFNVSNDVSGYTFQVGDTVLTPVSKNGMYYVEVGGITPDKLDELITLKVSNGKETMDVQYSPLYYMANQHANSKDENLKAAVKAMFNYCLEANTYLPATPAKPENTAAMKNSDGFLTFADLPANPLVPAEIEDYKALGFTTALLTEDYSRALAYYATVDEGLDTVALTDGQQALELKFTGYTGEGTMLQIKTNLPTDGTYGDFLVGSAPTGSVFNVKSARSIGWMSYSYDSGSNAVYLNPNFSDSFMDGEKFIIKAGTTFPVNGTDYVLCHDFIITVKNNYLASIDNLYNAGLNVWIRNYTNQPEYFTEKFTKALSNYKDKISGFYIADEAFDDETLLATANQGDITTSFDAIRDKEIGWFNTNFPNAYFHTNQVPYTSYDHYDNGTEPSGTADYAAKYNVFLDNYSKKILTRLGTAGKSMCYDNYPFIEKTRDSTNFWKDRQVLCDSYLFNMLLAANAAKNAPAGTDFGVCIQTFTGTGMRDITASSEVTFQLYTAMALGADMFEYFAYSSNSGMNGIIRNGEKALYDYVKAANNEALPFGKIIRAYDWQGIQLSKGTTHDNATDFNMITDAGQTLGSVTLNDDTNGLLSAVSTTYDAVIGCFKKDGKDGYMVVNYSDPVKKVRNNTVNLTFTSCKTATVYTSENGAIKEQFVTLTDGAYSTTIAPGKAFFIVPDYVETVMVGEQEKIVVDHVELTAGYTANSLVQFNDVYDFGLTDQGPLGFSGTVLLDGVTVENPTFLGYKSPTPTICLNSIAHKDKVLTVMEGSVIYYGDQAVVVDKTFNARCNGNTRADDEEIPTPPTKEYITVDGKQMEVVARVTLYQGYTQTNLVQFTNVYDFGLTADNMTLSFSGTVLLDGVTVEDPTFIGYKSPATTICLNNIAHKDKVLTVMKDSVIYYGDKAVVINATFNKKCTETQNPDGSFSYPWAEVAEIPFGFTYDSGTANSIKLKTNLPSSTPCKDFLYNDNGCNIDQSASDHLLGYASMINDNGTIVLTFNFTASTFNQGEQYVLKSGSVFGFTDGSSYTLDKDYVFTWDGNNWTVSNELTSVPVMNMTYRWGGANVFQVNTDLPSDTTCASFLVGENGCVIDESASDHLLGYASMINDNGTIVLTFNFPDSPFNRGEQYVLKSGSVFGFTNGKTYTLDKDYVFTWDGTVWTMINEIPATMTLAYRWGDDNTLQVNTNLPSTTPIANFLASENGCDLNQEGSAKNFAWVSMANDNGTIILTFEFYEYHYTSGQQYVLKRGSVFGFTDGNKYRLDRDYTFTWDGSNWSLNNA